MDKNIFIQILHTLLLFTPLNISSDKESKLDTTCQIRYNKVFLFSDQNFMRKGGGGTESIRKKNILHENAKEAGSIW